MKIKSKLNNSEIEMMFNIIQRIDKIMDKFPVDEFNNTDNQIYNGLDCAIAGLTQAIEQSTKER